MLTIAWVLRSTQHDEDGVRLYNVVERGSLKRLLGETYRPSGTVRQAIAREAREPERIEALRARVIRAVAVAPAPSRGDEAGHEYLGDSVWFWPSGERRLEIYARVRARNATREPVHSFQLLAEETATTPKSSLKLNCKPQGGDIPPHGAALVECWEYRDTGVGDPVIEALRHKRISLRRASIASLSIGTMTIYPDYTGFADATGYQGWPQDAAGEELRKASCAELSICEQLAQRKAAAEARGRAADEARRQKAAAEASVPDWRSGFMADAQARAQAEREADLQRLNRQIIPGVLTMLLLAGAASFVTRRNRAEARSWVVSGFTGLTLLAAAAGVYLFIGMSTARGWGALLFFGLALYYVAPLLLFSLLGLGYCLAGSPAYVTRFRMFVLFLGILTPVFFWTGLYALR